MQIRAQGSTAQLPTRIEFSRRKSARGVFFEPVDAEIVQTYNLRPILLSHYDLETAFAQKVEALLGRSETQARDVFDLAHLFDRGATGSRVKKNRKEIAVASDNASSVSFDQFKSQVVAYLPPEYRDYYGGQKEWEKLQEKVLGALERV